VVLPTGMGKTNIFLMLAAHRLKQYPGSKILLIGPTKPLIDQYYRVFVKYFDMDPEKFAIFTGSVKPEKRQEMWQSAQIIFSTPQGLENDVISSRIDLKDVSLLGVDEAHRAVGEYSYVFLAKQYHKLARYPRIIAMTASPGSELEKINEVIQNLFIEDIEIRTDKSPDVSKYIQELKINWINVTLPEKFNTILNYLNNCFKSKLKEIKNHGYISSIQMYSGSKKDLLRLQAQLQGEIAQGNRDFAVLKSVSLAAEAMKVSHAIELLETQGIEPLNNYLNQIESQSRTSKVKAVQNLVRDVNFRSALILSKSLLANGDEHPKLDELKKLVEQKLQQGKKLIVFTQYRDSGAKIVSELHKIGAKPVLFVGQAKKNGSGLTQKKQIEILDQFRQDIYNVLVSSSVGEEGLDIPQVDSVIFYEPIPSAIRHIQRRGRTARLSEGEVTILVTKGTRDEAYKWTAYHKEKRMYKTLESLKQKIIWKKYEKQEKKQDLDITISADYREKGSGVMKELIDNDIKLKLESLAVGDYLLSQQCAVEFKTVEDFVDSLIDGRLLKQVRELKMNFPKPLIIVEGSRDIYSIRNIHPNAIKGMLATITVSYGVPILYTKNHKDTASIFQIIANREQDDTSKGFSMHGIKKPMSLKEQQEYIVSALPGVGPSLAKHMLEKFGTVKKTLIADEDQLKEVDLIGKKKAEAIKDVLNSPYG